jgi:hypothetical protein
MEGRHMSTRTFWALYMLVYLSLFGIAGGFAIAGML